MGALDAPGVRCSNEGHGGFRAGPPPDPHPEPVSGPHRPTAVRFKRSEVASWTAPDHIQSSRLPGRQWSPDPTYDFPDDVPVDDETWDEEAVADEPVEEPVDEDERVVPLDAEDFRGPEEEES